MWQFVSDIENNIFTLFCVAIKFVENKIYDHAYLHLQFWKSQIYSHTGYITAKYDFPKALRQKVTDLFSSLNFF